MAREIRQIKRDVERRRKSWMTTAIPKKKKNAVTQFLPGNAYVASGRSWKKKKERWRRSSLTSTRVTSVELSVTGCEWVRERERDTFEIIFPFESRYLCNEKSYQRKKLLRKKGIKIAEMLTVIRCHVCWIVFKLKYLTWSTTATKSL